MLNVIIVDDEENVRESLSRLLALYHPHVKLCASADSLAAAVSAIQTHRPNLLLLDIELGEENAFELFKHFPRPDFRIIFITAYEQYALQAFRFSALDYLLKPVDPELLAEALRKAEDVLDQENAALKISSFLHNLSHPSKAKKIILKTADTIHLVSLQDILYCKAERNYTAFYLADQSRILVSTTMGDYEELFESYGFFRIHQSYLLNLDYFKRYEKGDGGKAILKDNSSLPVATRKKDQLLKILANL